MNDLGYITVTRAEIWGLRALRRWGKKAKKKKAQTRGKRSGIPVLCIRIRFPHASFFF